MNNFEQRLTAWVDGELAGEELIAFEQELDDNPDLRKHAIGMRQLGAAIQSDSEVPEMGNEDFFNRQVMQRIATESTSSSVITSSEESGWAWLWRIPKIAWAGAFCLAMSLALYSALIPAESVAEGSGTFVKTLSSQDADIFVSEFSGKGNRYAVVWIDGMDFLPDDYRVQ